MGLPRTLVSRGGGVDPKLLSDPVLKSVGGKSSGNCVGSVDGRLGLTLRIRVDSESSSSV